MANSLTASVSVSLAFTQTDERNQSTLVEQTSTTSSYAFTNGTGAGEINAGFQTTGVLPLGGETHIDFTDLKRYVFNAIQTVNFDGGLIKAFVFSNKSDNLMRLSAPPTSGVSEFFHGTGNVPVYPNSAFTFIDISGVPIDSAGHYCIKVKDENQGTANFSIYDFSVVGVTG